MRPFPGPGTGPSSFLGRNHWQKPDHVIQYPAPRGRMQCSCRHRPPNCSQNSKHGPATALTTINATGKASSLSSPQDATAATARSDPPPSPAQHFQTGAPLPEFGQIPPTASTTARCGPGPKAAPSLGQDHQPQVRPGAAAWGSGPVAPLYDPQPPANLSFSVGACHPGQFRLPQTCCFPTWALLASRNRPLTENVRCFGPVGGDLPATQL